KDAAELLALYNPFPDDAIVDLRFTTETGRTSPQALAGLVVKARQMMEINLDEHVHRRDVVATTVDARTGRLVAARLEVFDGTAGRNGVSIATGVPSPAPAWYVPEGYVDDGVVERYQVFNPSEGDEARVEVDFVLDQGEAEPL